MARSDPGPLVVQALTLIVRQHGGEPEAVAAVGDELERWRRTSPEHEAAWRAACAAWQGSESTALRDALPLPADLARRRRARRATLGGLLVLGGGAGAVAVFDRYWARPQFEGAYATQRAQLLSQTFSDGSRIDLNARTRLKVSYFRDRRVITLAGGEAAFRVTPDAARPYLVQTPFGTVRVVGTDFTVACHTDAAGTGHMEVRVSEGRVLVWARETGRDAEDRASASAPASAQTLAAGQSMRMEARAGEMIVGGVDPIGLDSIGAWRSGWLSFDNARLAEVVEAWNDYVTPPLEIDPTLVASGLRLTGRYPIRDPGAFLSGLPQTHPVRVLRAEGGQVRIEAITRSGANSAK